MACIDDCENPNGGNNNHQENRNEVENETRSTMYGQGLGSNPFAVPRVTQDDENVNQEETTLMESLFGLSPPSSPSSTSSGISNHSNKENENPEMPNYEICQQIINTYQDFMVTSVKQCFTDLLDLVTGFQFACVYKDQLTFCYSADEMLSLDNVTLARHFQIRDKLNDIVEKRFKNKLLLYLRILKDLLEEEKEDFISFDNENDHVILSLGSYDNTNQFIRRIKNLLRNGRHLKYSSMTWYERIVALLDDLNHLKNESHIHFSVQKYRHPDFLFFKHFKRYRLLEEEDDDENNNENDETSSEN